MPDRPALLDLELADQFFATADSAAIAEIRSICLDFTNDVTARIAGLTRDAAAGQLQAATATRELHQLRGAVANLGLARAAASLRDLEVHWATLTGAAQLGGLQLAADEVREGISALRDRYPYLKT